MDWIKSNLTFIGLLIEAVGVLMIFKWGPPQPDFQETVDLSVEDDTPLSDGRTAKQHADDVRKLKARYRRWSRFALVLILVGILIQLLDAFKGVGVFTRT